MQATVYELSAEHVDNTDDLLHILVYIKDSIMAIKISVGPFQPLKNCP